MVIIEAEEKQFLEYHEEIIEPFLSGFVNKQKNQIKSREKTGKREKSKEEIVKSKEQEGAKGGGRKAGIRK